MTKANAKQLANEVYDLYRRIYKKNVLGSRSNIQTQLLNDKSVVLEDLERTEAIKPMLYSYELQQLQMLKNTIACM